MYYLIYRSLVCNTIADESLRSLLIQSRDRNKAMGITGMLLFFDNKFLQLLEGEEGNVKQIYADIKEDSRHKEVITLKEGKAEQRLFSGWSMSFRTVTGDDIVKEPGYKDVYKTGSTEAMDLVALFNRLRGKSEG